MKASELTIGLRVKRDPRMWKNESRTFIVQEIKSGQAWITAFPVKKEKCVWTGKMLAPTPRPYEPKELVLA